MHSGITGITGIIGTTGIIGIGITGIGIIGVIGAIGISASAAGRMSALSRWPPLAFASGRIWRGNPSDICGGSTMTPELLAPDRMAVSSAEPD
jgi:hypothetical protein